jgi:hypothetical protein
MIIKNDGITSGIGYTVKLRPTATKVTQTAIMYPITNFILRFTCCYSSFLNENLQKKSHSNL